jgi:hypothetical protein
VQTTFLPIHQPRAYHSASVFFAGAEGEHSSAFAELVILNIARSYSFAKLGKADAHQSAIRRR